MSHLTLPLDRLHPHPANANVMPRELFRKLVAHLERTDRYPPIIVRPLARAPSARGDQESQTNDQEALHQILDGHHRVAALRALGRTEARCVVWEVDDAEALVLLATLNRLQGRDDPWKRAALLGQLVPLAPTARDLRDLARTLPESPPRLTRLLALNRPAPAPRRPPAPSDLPVAVHFFLLPAQRRRLEARLAALGGTREAALLRLVDGPVGPRRL